MLLTIEFLKMRFWTFQIASIKSWTDGVRSVNEATVLSWKILEPNPVLYWWWYVYPHYESFLHFLSHVLELIWFSWPYLLFLGFSDSKVCFWLANRTHWKPVLSNIFQAGAYKAFSILASLLADLKLISASLFQKISIENSKYEFGRNGTDISRCND